MNDFITVMCYLHNKQVHTATNSCKFTIFIGVIFIVIRFESFIRIVNNISFLNCRFIDVQSQQ